MNPYTFAEYLILGFVGIFSLLSILASLRVLKKNAVGKSFFLLALALLLFYSTVNFGSNSSTWDGSLANLEVLAALPVFITYAIAALLYLREHLLRFPLNAFGLEDVNRVLSLESESIRNEVLSRGWMTNFEWAQMKQRHSTRIQDELEKRGGHTRLNRV